MTTTLIIIAAVLYAVAFVAGNTGRCNSWDATLVDRLVWFPLEGALRIFGGG